MTPALPPEPPVTDRLGACGATTVFTKPKCAQYTLTRLLTKKLKDKTLGWIKDHYFNSLVKLDVLDTGEIVVEFSGNLLDNYGLPDFDYQGSG